MFCTRKLALVRPGAQLWATGQTGSKPVKKKRFHLWRWSWSVPTKILTCSTRSDSGVRREGRNEKKNKKKNGGEGERRERLVPSLWPYPTPSLFFFLLTSLCAIPTIWTPGAGYLNCGQKRFSSFHRISIHKNFSITLLRISLKPHNSLISHYSNKKTWLSLFCIFIFLTCYISVIVVILNLC